MNLLPLLLLGGLLLLGLPLLLSLVPGHIHVLLKSISQQICILKIFVRYLYFQWKTFKFHKSPICLQVFLEGGLQEGEQTIKFTGTVLEGGTGPPPTPMEGVAAVDLHMRPLLPHTTQDHLTITEL